MATQQQFLDFLHDIEPSDSTKATCSSAHTTLRTRLAAHETFKAVHVNTFLSGSYARNTALRPGTHNGHYRRPDVDIIVVTKYTPQDLPSNVIANLRRTMKQLGYDEVEANRRSVCVKLSGIEMDVVPIIPGYNPGEWLIADKSEEKWLDTNPMGHNDWAKEANRVTNSNFKPLVKLVKWWRRHGLPHLKRPKGFILETMVFELMDRKETRYEELFVKLMERIETEYRFYANSGQVPYLADPSVHGNNVFSRVKPEEFKRFYDLAASHAALARRAQKETDPDKSLELWQRIFGDRFRKPSAKAASLLTTVSGAGLVFPDKPVTPPNKPAGFA